MGRLLVKVGTGGQVTVVEDGQIDLATLGEVKKRERLGLIGPCPDEPSKLEIVMMNEKKPRKLTARHKKKKEALAAETDEARKLLKKARRAEEAQQKPVEEEEPPKTVKAKVGNDGPLPTGIVMVRCPICKYPLHAVVVIRKISLRKGTTDVVFKCNCPS